VPDEGQEPEEDGDQDDAEVPLDELEDLGHRDKETGSESGRRTNQPVKTQQVLKPDEVQARNARDGVVRGLDATHRLQKGVRTGAYDNVRSGDESIGAGGAGPGPDKSPGTLPPTSSNNSEVLEAFDHGDMRRPYVIGPEQGADRGINRILALVALALAVGALGVAIGFHELNTTGTPTALFAAVDANATIAEQSHVVTVSISSSTGDYNVTFDRSVSGCTYQANPGQWPGSGSPAPSTLPYRTAGAPDSVFVHTGGPGAFYLAVTC
jgi:hypothetical protein